MKTGLCVAALLISTAAFAQTSRPGPYVIDLRGAMAGAPTGAGFYRPVASSTIVPKRAFGFAIGAHVYPLQIGVARLGVGIDAMRTRGRANTPTVTATGTGTAATTRTFASTATMNVTGLAGQVSFNFGTRDGWSYLSAGYGRIHTSSEVSSDVAGPIEHSVVSVDRQSPAINYGGGARWFIRGHLATGFDVRFYRMGADGSLPGTRVFALSAGVSVR